jgi:hypothetical protein
MEFAYVSHGRMRGVQLAGQVDGGLDSIQSYRVYSGVHERDGDALPSHLSRVENISMQIDRPELDCAWTIGQVIERYPATADVFKLFKVDGCCGSAVSVHEAARCGGVSTDALCGALEKAVR